MDYTGEFFFMESGKNLIVKKKSSEMKVINVRSTDVLKGDYDFFPPTQNTYFTFNYLSIREY